MSLLIAAYFHFLFMTDDSYMCFHYHDGSNDYLSLNKVFIALLICSFSCFFFFHFLMGLEKF